MLVMWLAWVYDVLATSSFFNLVIWVLDGSEDQDSSSTSGVWMKAVSIRVTKAQAILKNRYLPNMNAVVRIFVIKPYKSSFGFPPPLLCKSVMDNRFVLFPTTEHMTQTVFWRCMYSMYALLRQLIKRLLGTSQRRCTDDSLIIIEIRAF